MRWLQLRFDFHSTGVRREFDCLSKVIKVTNHNNVNRAAAPLAAVTMTFYLLRLQFNSLVVT